MCCNTKAGPKRAIAYIENHIDNLSITQTDWHLIREAASGGGKLSSAIASPERAAQAARQLTWSYGDSTPEAERFIEQFAVAKNTEGTCRALEHLASNGLPPEVVTRKRRGAKSSVAPTANEGCQVQNVGRSAQRPLYRVTYKGRPVTVTAGLAAARRIAERFEQMPRW